MSIRAEDVIQIVVHGTAFDQAAANILYYAPDVEMPGDDVANLEAILGDFRTRWRSAVLPLLSASYTVLKYAAAVIQGSEVITPEEGPPYKTLVLGTIAEITGTLTDSGGGTTVPLPLHATMTVQKRTNLGGRKNHGSIRLSPILAGAVESDDPNTLTSAAVTAGAAVATFLKTPLTVIGFEGQFDPVLLGVRRLINAAPANTTNAFRVKVTGGLVNQHVGSQVSRKTRRSLGA